MIISKLTSKAQTTIPRAVRAALGVEPGDEIVYAIEDGRVVLTKATQAEFPPANRLRIRSPPSGNGRRRKTTKLFAICDERRRLEGRHRSESC